MARIRSVHPEICIDEALATVSASAERTFVRLWLYMDDAGRIKDHPKLLAAQLYPLHDAMNAEGVNADMDELKGAGILLRYEADGVKIAACKPEAWARYQKPRHPMPSRLPEPPQGNRAKSTSVRPTAADRRNDTADDGASPKRFGRRGEEGRGVGDGVGGERETPPQCVGTEAHRAEVVPLPHPTTSPWVPKPAKNPRPRDVLFDALAEEWGCTLNGGHWTLTRAERGKLNSATSQLREIGATDQEVHQKARQYRHQHPSWEFTPNALVSHWSASGNARPTSARERAIQTAREMGR